MTLADGSVDSDCRSLLDSPGFDGTRDLFVRSFRAGCESRLQTLPSADPVRFRRVLTVEAARSGGRTKGAG